MDTCWCTHQRPAGSVSAPASSSRAAPSRFPSFSTSGRRNQARRRGRWCCLAAAAAGSRQPASEGLVAAGPTSPSPDYSTIDAHPLNKAVYGLFKGRMVQAIGSDSQLDGYDAIIELTRRLNAMHASPRRTQEVTRTILRSLFPSWLPPAFAVMFSKPMPGLSCQLNAWATWLTCQWLMGECEVNDVEVDGGRMGKAHGVLVKRCRYLEEAGCASVCINSCKDFFVRDMGLPLEMKPNYEDFSCQFSFGKTPPPKAEDAAFATPCFQQCPTARRAAAAAELRCPQIELTQP